MFGKEFLIDRDLVVGISFFCFLRLNDDVSEIVVAKKENTDQIACWLIARLELYGALRGGERFFCKLLVPILDLRKRFGVEVLQEWIVGMELALLFEEGECGGAIVLLAEQHAHGIFGEG